MAIFAPLRTTHLPPLPRPIAQNVPFPHTDGDRNGSERRRQEHHLQVALGRPGRLREDGQRRAEAFEGAPTPLGRGGPEWASQERKQRPSGGITISEEKFWEYQPSIGYYGITIQ